ncbi:MAG: phosphatidate cytidylyltransferase [Actinomycetota bacterium]|nr:phosphatidate cytidylyltransferase [Actinomycetota bacterium]
MTESVPAEEEHPSPAAASVPGRSLTQAVITAVVLILIAITAYVIGVRAFLVLATIVVLAAQFELLYSLRSKDRRPSLVLGLACTFGMVLAAYVERPGFIAAVLAVALVGGFVWALRPTRGNSPGSDVAWLLLSVAWIGGGGAGAVSILALDPGGLNILVTVVAVIALGDIAAYFVGTNLGRHKLAPSISPGKSWEGFVAGLVTSLGAGPLLSLLIEELEVVDGLAVGALCGLLAPVGDLIESLVKREIGIKDSSDLLPGHGGFLDRLDAIIFCSPAVYLYLRLVVF